MVQAVTLQLSHLPALEPREGKGWMINLPIFTVENLETWQAIKSQKLRARVLVQFHIISIFSIFSIFYYILLNGNEKKNLLSF